MADGTTLSVKRQHPHDSFMEMAASYSLKLGETDGPLAYFGKLSRTWSADDLSAHPQPHWDG